MPELYTTKNMEEAASCIFGCAAIFGIHLFYPRKETFFHYQIIPSLFILSIIVFINVYFVIHDYWCLIGYEKCVGARRTVTLIFFSLTFKVILCFKFFLSFYYGAFKCKETIKICTRVEKLAHVLNCTEKISDGAKKLNNIFLFAVVPITLVILLVDLSTIKHLNYLSVCRYFKGWFAYFSILIWEWKYVFFASTQGNLFDELNIQIQVMKNRAPIANLRLLIILDAGIFATKKCPK